MKYENFIYAYRASILCQNSYNEEYGISPMEFLITEFMPHEITTIMENFTNKLTFYTAKDAENVLYVVFRGTDSCTNWFENFMFFPKKIKPYGNTNTYIKVHTGFYNEYQTLRPHIFSLIKEKYSDCKEIIVAGHSLGSALAELCAVDIQYNFGIVPLVFGFGSPRVGNKQFVNSYKKRIPTCYEFSFNNDPVTKVPLEIMGYKHINLLKLIGVSCKWWSWIPLIGRFSSHFPQNYVRASSEISILPN